MMLSVPIFYFILHAVMLLSLDEGLSQQKELIVKQLQKAPVGKFISYSQNIRIAETSNSVARDSFFTRDIFVESDSEMVSHRILETTVNINGKHYTIFIQKSLIENDDLIQTIVAIQFGLLMLLFTGLFFINWKLSRKIWQPFYTTLRELTNFRINDNKSLKLPKSNIDEFDELNHCLTNLTTNASQLFNAQKEFTENASHELQTPIAIMQGKLELLMQTSPISAEQAALIGAAYDAGQRMFKLNRTLLLLSKLENNQFLLTDQINIQQSVRSLVGLYDQVAFQKHIRLSIQTKGDTFLQGNKSLFDVMVGNLLNNAITHSKPRTGISVDVTPFEIRVCNPNGGLRLDEARLFKRFQKQNANDAGTGLGLEIAKKIAAIHHATLQYKAADNLHCFAIIMNQVNP